MWPNAHQQRARERLGVTTVSCEVSGRYLKFHEQSYRSENGEYITVDVMPMFEDEIPQRRICQLVITREELMEALSHVIPSD